jgi:hypothetical protein
LERRKWSLADGEHAGDVLGEEERRDRGGNAIG